ncbi:ras GEF, partial [Ramicandelaber brevisporus]
MPSSLPFKQQQQQPLSPPLSTTASTSPKSALPSSAGGNGDSGATVPWFLDDMARSNTITVDSNTGSVTGGTIAGLVEHLTPHNTVPNAKYVNAFMLTFRGFCTPLNFAHLLIQRFRIPPPSDVAKDHRQMDMWIQRRQIPIRMRVLSVLRSWFEDYYFEGSDDARAVPVIYEFIKTEMIPALQQESIHKLLELVHSRMIDADFAPRLTHGTIKVLRSTIEGTRTFHSAFLDIDAMEMARQLTLMESRLLLAIQPRELLNLEFTKPADRSLAPNVHAMINASNRITKWVIVTIMTEEDPRIRLNILKQYVRICEFLLQIGNFNLLIAIMAGLNSSMVSRLQASGWDVLPEVLQGADLIMYEINDTISERNQYAKYRRRLRDRGQPSIPFLGALLSDL